MSSTIVFIAGLTHSGSTILDFVLGAQPGLVGLGEIVPLLNPASSRLDQPSRQCSCGLSVADCPFWGEVRRRLASTAAATLSERYVLALEVFRDVFGPQAIPVDSSKSLGALKVAAAARPDDLRVIHIIRDVRSWVVSRKDVDVRQGRYKFRDLYGQLGLRAWKPFLMRNPYAKFLIWYFGNRQLEQYLERSRLPHTSLSYEELCFCADVVIAELRAFLGSDVTVATSHLASSRSHIALGNSVRLKTHERSSIRYDTRWLHRSEWLGPSLLFPPILQYNRTVANRRLTTTSG